jgi:hypothetical protein
MGVVESFDGPVVVEARLGLACFAGWGDLLLAVPVD